MKKAYKIILICLTALCGIPAAVAQELPLMPSDPAVSYGTLANGMSYYVVANPTSKGLADFALVQRTGTQTVPDGDSRRVVSLAKDALASLPRLCGESTQSYLSRHGVTPEKGGFVKVSENATLYHFDNVVVSAGDHAVDSTLLVLLDIAGRGFTGADGFISRWYAPSDQAVIVSGDVDPAMVVEKLRLMSLMIPAGESQQRSEYVWQDSEEPVFESSTYVSRPLATVSATWASPRTPKEYMNTVQPAIYEMFVTELGIIAKERLSQKMRAAGIPVADISYNHLDSVRSLGDESFTVSVTVGQEHADKAVTALAEVMSSLDAGKAAVHEVEMARRRYVAMVTARSEELLKSNPDYVDRCASAFLYNAPLSSGKEVLAFLRSRDLDPATERRLFNNVASALLDGCRNLTVECQTANGHEMGSSQLRDMFSEAWERGCDLVCKAPVDSLPLPGPGLKIKLKSTRSEHMSGGVIWTFENGFRVVYKRCDTGKRLHYSLALNGGYGNMKSLSKGEGAYMTDFLNLCSISGVPGEDFRLALEAEGVTFEPEVNLSNTIVSGSAPESKAEFLMRVLLAVAGEMEPDPEAYGYFRECVDITHEYSRGSFRDRTAAIDSLMCPDYIYSPMKTPGKLTDAFPEKAAAFLDAQMQKMNDGLLVLMGNIEETKLRKMLQLYAGGFRTTSRSFPRTVVHYQPVSGACSYTASGRQNSADVTMSVNLPLTADNYMASILASEVLRQNISKALDGTGTYMRLARNCRIYPNERFNVMVTLEEASPDGFASGAELAGFDEAVGRLRETLDQAASMDVLEETLEKYRKILKGHLSLMQQDPSFRIRAIVMRYLDGKDLTTNYEAKIDAVTPQKVKAILSSLTNASKVEYIIRK